MISEKPILIKTLKIKGYKSIKDETIEFNNINVLIGCNGAGKSNLLSLFMLLNNVSQNRLRSYVSEKGGAQSLLYKGKKETSLIDVQINNADLHRNGLLNYDFRLQVDEEDSLFAKNYTAQSINGMPDSKSTIFPGYNGFAVYHVDDTTLGAKIKQAHNLVDDIELRADAANLAPFLYSYKKRMRRNTITISKR